MAEGLFSITLGCYTSPVDSAWYQGPVLLVVPTDHQVQYPLTASYPCTSHIYKRSYYGIVLHNYQLQLGVVSVHRCSCCLRLEHEEARFRNARGPIIFSWLLFRGVPLPYSPVGVLPPPCQPPQHLMPLLRSPPVCPSSCC